MGSLPSFELVPPSALRERLNDAVLNGTKTATSRLVVMDRMSGTPTEPVGTRMRLLDSNLDTVAVVEITGTQVLPFGLIGADVAALEGEWLTGIEDWRAAHTRYWNSQKPHIRAYLSDDRWELTEDSLVIVRFFKLIQEDQ